VPTTNGILVMSHTRNRNGPARDDWPAEKTRICTRNEQSPNFARSDGHSFASAPGWV
jgi:hypothetical protein